MKREKLEILTKKPFKWWDLALVLAFVLMLILPYVLMPKRAGATVEIYRNNRLIASLKLSEDREYRYENNGIVNLIRIAGGTVAVVEADCPDGLCRRMRPISRENEVILCIPSGLKIEISGAASDVDGETSSLAVRAAATCFGEDER